MSEPKNSQEGIDMRRSREDDAAMRDTINSQARSISKLQTTLFGAFLTIFLGGFAGFQMFGSVERQVTVNTSGLSDMKAEFTSYVRGANEDISDIRQEVGVLKTNVVNLTQGIKEFKDANQKSTDKMISKMEEFGEFHAKTDESIREAIEFIRHEQRK